MKKLFFFLFIFLYLSAVVSGQKSIDSSRIEVKYVDPNLESKVDVSCEKFESAFEKDAYRNYTIMDSFLLDKLKAAVEKLRYFKEPDDIDVRYKLFIHFAGNKAAPIVVCVDKRNEAMINGQSVSSEKFFSLLKKVIALIPKEFLIK